MRQPSSLISCTQSGPFGGRSTRRQVANGMKSGSAELLLARGFLAGRLPSGAFPTGGLFLGGLAAACAFGRGRSPLSPSPDLTLVLARFLRSAASERPTSSEFNELAPLVAADITLVRASVDQFSLAGHQWRPPAVHLHPTKRGRWVLGDTHRLKTDAEGTASVHQLDQGYSVLSLAKKVPLPAAPVAGPASAVRLYGRFLQQTLALDRELVGCWGAGRVSMSPSNPSDHIL